MTRIRLNNNWEFLKGDIGGIWEALRPATTGSPESVPLWEKVALPHCFNAYDAVDPDVNYYQGPGWYRTLLDIKNPFTDGRTILHFEGAGQKTEVYVGMTRAGSHVGGYDEWSVDITDECNLFRQSGTAINRFDGKIPVAIRCDNSRDLEMIPSDMSDFNLYGGIYRYLNLVYLPALSIERLYIRASLDASCRSGRIEVSAGFYNKSCRSDASVSVQILDPHGKIINQTTVAVMSLDGEAHLWSVDVVGPDLWSPEQPNIYSCVATLCTPDGENTVTARFGFRNYEFAEKGPFILNGKRLLLRGTHRHEDHAGVGAAMTEEMMRTEILLMKEMGVNFIRLGHYQQSGIFLDLCDSHGILVWEEIPWCRGGLGGDQYRDQAKRMLSNMIMQHKNHPSVIIWGMGNENDWPGDFPEFDEEKIREFMNELNDLSHRLDPARKTAIRRCDFCRDIVDVYSPSIWAGWYRGNYTDYRHVAESEMQRVKHFLHIEWGGDSHARRHSESPESLLTHVSSGTGADERLGDASLHGGDARVSKDGDWSESYICDLFDWHLKEQEKMPQLTGSAFWTFKDFSTPLRPDNPVPYVNQKGVVERDFTKKESYYLFQSYWTDKPMVHIYGHSWPVRWGTDGGNKTVKVYSNCEEAELFMNGESSGIRKRNSQDFPAAGLRWSVRFRKGENRIRVVARKGSETVSDEIIQQYQTDKWEDPESMCLTKISSDPIIVQAELYDRNNIPCLDAAGFAIFSCAGDGKLIADQGTSTGSSKVQLYNGRALIRVRANGGKSVVAVSYKGVPTAFLEV